MIPAQISIMRTLIGHGLEIVGVALVVIGTPLLAVVLRDLIAMDGLVHGTDVTHQAPYWALLAIPPLFGCAFFGLGHRLMSEDCRVFFRR